MKFSSIICLLSVFIVVFSSGVNAAVKGDVDDSNEIELADAIVSLQVLTGSSVTINDIGIADVNGDTKIGIEEPIYILQTVAELREPEYISTSGSITGIVKGLNTEDQATAILGNDAYLDSCVTDANGSFAFTNVPNGDHYLKIDVNGYVTEKAKKVTVTHRTRRADSSESDPIEFNIERLDSGVFTYHWEEDGSRSGYQQTAHINERPLIQFLDETLEVPAIAAAEKLQRFYNIILSNEVVSWNQEYAYRLLETMEIIPQQKRSSYQSQTLALKPSKWILTDDYIADDITINRSDEGDIITISVAAFVYATPKLILLDGLKGTFFSQRLHHAIVRYVTDNGQDITAVEQILNERYGCTTIISDYTALTAPTTGEDQFSFQSFHSEELVRIINMFEEMPGGYHVVEGLKYLVRRKDGMPHPLYDAPAVAWPTAHDESYIEFMDIAFLNDSIYYVHRLIIHEKSHFIWANLFSEQTKNEWIQAGGWYENPDDPDGWSTTKTTEFVSAYAHGKNPNEDMAESIADYILNPDILKSRSPSKYEFVRDRIMHGSIYLSKIREDLTFEVLNLLPDYNYPGKIKRIDITVSGSPIEDKTVTVELELNIIDKLFDGAQKAIMRIFSEIGTFTDLYVYPVNSDGSILRGSFTLSKYSKNGLWFTDQIVVTDTVGNQRFEGVDDFGWRMYVDNSMEDILAPQYVPNSLALALTQLTPSEISELSGLTLSEIEENGHEVQKLNITWDVLENIKMRDSWPAYAQVTNPGSEAYRLEEHGTFDSIVNQASVDIYITEYYAPGHYGVPYIKMTDQALNVGRHYFSDSPQHEPLSSVYVSTSPNPDVLPPEIDLNRITVTALPVNIAAPNGETLVTIVYYAKDDKSGLGKVSYRLLDPQGISHFEYHYHENFYQIFFVGNPSEWTEYEINVVLPQGSPAGIWGFQELNVSDKAHNTKNYNFVETMHFEILSN